MIYLSILMHGRTFSLTLSNFQNFTKSLLRKYHYKYLAIALLKIFSKLICFGLNCNRIDLLMWKCKWEEVDEQKLLLNYIFQHLSIYSVTKSEKKLTSSSQQTIVLPLAATVNITIRFLEKMFLRQRYVITNFYGLERLAS